MKQYLKLLATLAVLVVALATNGAGPTGAQAGDKSLEDLKASDYHFQEIYGGLAVASMRLRTDELAAYILVDGETRAVYELSIRDRSGRWRVFDAGEERDTAPLTMTFDYQRARVRNFDGDIRELLARHSVLSVALSAVLLWEDYVDGSSPAVIDPIPQLPFGFPEGGLPEGDDYDQCIAAGLCTISQNGCTVVPDNCPPFSTATIRESCNEHDSCYQCGEACFGYTRLQCDRDLRINITFQANSACAWVYFLGVRAAGWLFYQTTTGGIGLMHDVYSLGISISACEGQYAHMCTVYVF